MIGFRCVEYGIDYYGFNLALRRRVTHWSDCARHCENEAECAFWTWIMDNKVCLLKSSNIGRRRRSNALSGNRLCTSEC